MDVRKYLSKPLKISRTDQSMTKSSGKRTPTRLSSPRDSISDGGEGDAQDHAEAKQDSKEQEEANLRTSTSSDDSANITGGRDLSNQENVGANSASHHDDETEEMLIHRIRQLEQQKLHEDGLRARIRELESELELRTARIHLLQAAINNVIAQELSLIHI